MTEKPPTTTKPRGVAYTWTPRLGTSFTQVSRFFLDNFHKLRVAPKRNKKGRGMNTTEAMAIILLISHKWNTDSPYPSLGSIAERLGIELRSARQVMGDLEHSGYLQRETRASHRTNRYNLGQLFTKLEELMDKMVAQNDTIEEPTANTHMSVQ
jgi:DNA-binding MarR family transcriptional regulator